MERGRDSVSGSIWAESWIAMKAVMKVQTFQIIVLQGLVGSLPWTAMVFFTMWFELIGEHVCFYFFILTVPGFQDLQVITWLTFMYFIVQGFDHHQAGCLRFTHIQVESCAHSLARSWGSRTLGFYYE